MVEGIHTTAATEDVTAEGVLRSTVGSCLVLTICALVERPSDDTAVHGDVGVVLHVTVLTAAEHGTIYIRIGQLAGLAAAVGRESLILGADGDEGLLDVLHAGHEVTSVGRHTAAGTIDTAVVLALMSGSGVAHRAAGDGHRHLTCVVGEHAGEVVHLAAVGVDDVVAIVHYLVVYMGAGSLSLDGAYRCHGTRAIHVVPHVAAGHDELGIAIDGTGRHAVAFAVRLLVHIHSTAAGIDVAAEHRRIGHAVVVETYFSVLQGRADGTAGDLDLGVILHMSVGTAAEDRALDVGTRLNIDFGIVHVGHLHDVAAGFGCPTAAAAIDEAAVEALLVGIGRVADDAALDVHLGQAAVVAVGHLAGAGIHGLVTHRCQ